MPFGLCTMPCVWALTSRCRDDLRVTLLFVPHGATSFLQPRDVALFHTFKARIRRNLSELFLQKMRRRVRMRASRRKALGGKRADLVFMAHSALQEADTAARRQWGWKRAWPDSDPFSLVSIVNEASALSSQSLLWEPQTKG